MQKKTAILGTILGVSLLVNILTIQRLLEARNTRHVDPPDDDSWTYVENEPVSPEIDSPPAVTESQKPKELPSPVVSSSLAREPEVRRIVSEKRDFDGFRRDLSALSAMRRTLGQTKYRNLFLKRTFEYLRIPVDRQAGFRNAVNTMLTQFQESKQRMNHTIEQIKYEKKNGRKPTLSFDDAYKQYQQELKQSSGELDSHLDRKNKRHGTFRKLFGHWMDLYEGPK